MDGTNLVWSSRHEDGQSTTTDHVTMVGGTSSETMHTREHTDWKMGHLPINMLAYMETRCKATFETKQPSPTAVVDDIMKAIE